MRVSINPQFLHYNALTDSGINIGCNPLDQTVAPGESRTYTWYADKEYGTCTLNSFGDIRNHRYHGLFGAIIIEAPYATWQSQRCDTADDFADQALVTVPGKEPFQENVVFIQNGIRLLNRNGNLIKTGSTPEEELDPEDTGEKGYNYRSERFANRLENCFDPSLVFSSIIHGDPSTPIFYAQTGQKVVFRTLMPADKPRNVGFVLHGHMWPEHPNDSHSRIIPVQGHISIGNVFDIELIDGASLPGDYLYRSGSLRWDVEAGMWGIFRVTDAPINCNIKKHKNKFICKIHRFYKALKKQIFKNAKDSNC